MKKLAIIIVTYNSEKDIYDCVKSIKQYSDIPQYELELIIVDNCSSAPESMFVQLRELWGEGIVCIKNTSNGGYGRGNNIGLRYATSPIALIMNPDVRLIQPIFKRSLEFFSINEKIGLLGLRQMLSLHKFSRNSFCPTWMINGYMHAILYGICNRIGWYIPSCMYIQGSCFFLRKKMFEEIGMFDESNFLYCEEEDIHYRMKQRFGSKCFAFDRNLHYIHQTEGRAPSFEYERKKVDTDVKLYEKKGIDSRFILLHYLQNNRLILLRYRFIGNQLDRYQVYLQLNRYIKEKLGYC